MHPEWSCSLWSRFLAGAPCNLHTGAHTEAGFLAGYLTVCTSCWNRKGLMKRTCAGTVCAELQPVRKTHTGEFCGGQYLMWGDVVHGRGYRTMGGSWGGTCCRDDMLPTDHNLCSSCPSEGGGRRVKLEMIPYELTITPIPHVSSEGGVRRVKLSLRRTKR